MNNPQAPLTLQEQYALLRKELEESNRMLDQVLDVHDLHELELLKADINELKLEQAEHIEWPECYGDEAA